MFKNLFFFVLTVSTVVLVGCSSFESTIINRQSNDQLTKQCNPTTTKGIPVKLKVPSHMEVKILETLFIGPPIDVVTAIPLKQQLVLDTKTVELEYEVVDDSGKLDYKLKRKNPKTLKLKSKSSETKKTAPKMFRPGKQRILSVATEKIYTDKVFTVDFARPLAGTLSLTNGDNAGLGFDGQQYFSNINATYKEETLATATELLGGSTVADSKSTRDFNSKDQDNYTRIQRVVAFERFDINECGWEQRMAEFVNKYLGNCNNACGIVCESCTQEAAFGANDLPQQPPIEQVASVDPTSTER